MSALCQIGLNVLECVHLPSADLLLGLANEGLLLGIGQEFQCCFQGLVVLDRHDYQVLATVLGDQEPIVRAVDLVGDLGPPTETVATGTPAGICTIDSSESSPSRWRSGTGTPITGSTVAAATIPGRWAAPPAPAMTTRNPRPAAVSAYSSIRRGVRCAETTCASYGTPNSASAAAAGSIIGQSESLPMTMPTIGSTRAPRCSVGLSARSRRRTPGRPRRRPGSGRPRWPGRAPRRGRCPAPSRGRACARGAVPCRTSAASRRASAP